jgi:hypothetical protein
MASGRFKWNEKKVTAMLAEGRGQGHGENYLPWIEATMLSSLGRTRRVWGHKTNRVHHLLSDVEYRLFLALEWSADVVDIREQFPLDRDLTLEVARTLGMRHPYYPGTDVATVMTVDFMTTRIRHGQRVPEAFNAKRTEEAEDENSLAKLEIQRETLQLMEIPHHLVLHSHIPEQQVKNIEWIRDAMVKPDEKEPRPGYFGALMMRMMHALQHSPGPQTLTQYCNQFDEHHGCEAGTGLRVVRMLMHERIINARLDVSSLCDTLVSELAVSASRGNLRAIGGA